MTDLTRLSVSLTKHGSHKVAALLESFRPDEVISRTSGKVLGINIDAGQARKVLSAMEGDKLPSVWHDVKMEGRTNIDGLVLIAIVFSHHRLIDAMAGGVRKFGVGLIKRDDVGGKAYTNMKGEFENLNALTAQNKHSFSFDIRHIIRDGKLGKLALLVFERKLTQAGWSRKNTVLEECINVGFHRALGMSEVQFRAWTSPAVHNLDILPETVDADISPSRTFKFKAGHVKRRSGEVVKRGSGESAKAKLIHNDLQNKLYDHLCSKVGRSKVGTEITSGPTLTSIDLVVATKSGFVFYEIKTSTSLRKCIREAISQLMEYSYWPKEERASELVIVTMNSPTEDARDYLSHLRTKFNLPVYHETISRKTGVLSARI